MMRQKRFPLTCGPVATLARMHHKCRNRLRKGRIVLNAPLSSVNWLNDPVSAWGLYKSDDDQTHFDDWRGRGGWCGVGLVRAGSELPGAELSAAPRPDLFPLSAERCARGLPPCARDAQFRLAGRRGRSRLGRAVAARSGDVARRSPLWPPDECSAGLFRPRRAAGPGDVAG